jgi:cobalt-zinc-cadmium efflux system membrane fusion protein
MTGQKSLNKGSRIVVIRSSEILTLQQHYLEAKNLYEFSRQEYLRQGELAVENATSVKKMENAKKEYLAAEITMKSLAKQLTMHGFNPDSVRSENLSDRVVLYSPDKCYITSIQANTGDFVSAGTHIVLLSDKEIRLIKFEVPEEYYYKIAPGSKVTYHAAFDSTLQGMSILRNVVSRVDTVTHTFTGYAVIEQDTILVPGMSVQAELLLNP